MQRSEYTFCRQGWRDWKLEERLLYAVDKRRGDTFRKQITITRVPRYPSLSLSLFFSPSPFPSFSWYFVKRRSQRGWRDTTTNIKRRTAIWNGRSIRRREWPEKTAVEFASEAYSSLKPAENRNRSSSLAVGCFLSIFDKSLNQRSITELREY